MSDKTTLLPCPFCGGKAHILKDGIPYVVVECECCFGRTNCNVTEAEAVAAWNTRAERTCEYCKDGTFDRQTAMMSNHGWQVINYCPNCGAKVVEK